MEKRDINTIPSLRLFAGVFLLSLAILSFEILVSRITSVIFIHNYAFMVVSLAILGLGCGGIFVFYRWRRGEPDEPYREFSFYSSLFATSVSLFIILITATDFFTNRLLYFLVLFIPFFLAGVVLSLAFRSFAQESFKLYASDLLGAASGSLLSIWILNTFGGVNGALFVGVLGTLASFVFITGYYKKFISLKIPIFLSMLCFLLFFINTHTPFLGEVPIGKHRGKDMYNMLSEPLFNPEVIETRWSAFGRTDLARYKTDDSAMTLFIDGAAGTAMYKFDGDLKNPGKDIESLKVTFSGFFPFLFLKEDEKDSMLVIGPGGGKEVLLGLLAGVRNIIGVEVNKDFVDIVKEYKDYNGGIYTDFKNVDIIISEGRSFLRDSDRKYDIIMLTLPITKSSRSFEGYALTENYLLTVESIKDYFDHLTENGRMIVVLHDTDEMLRFVVTALTALEKMGIKNQDAMKHIYTLGRGMNPLLVLKRTPFTPEEANSRHQGMHLLKFDYPPSSYLPHIEQKTIMHEHAKGVYHKLNMFNNAMVAILNGNIKLHDLITLMPYDISPTRDDKPFFFKHGTGLTSDISSLLGFVILVNILVIGIPGIYKRVHKNMVKPLALFMLLGAGFMMVEISFLQKLTLYLGSPTISLVVLLGSLLLGMGAGSFFGRRFYPNSNIDRLKVFSSAIFIGAIALFFIQPLILNNLLGNTTLIKGLVCSAFLIPLGFVMGVPFPTAISLLKETGAERTIAWMYGVNGTMSVLGSVAAIAISLTLGFSSALIAGALCYLAIAVISRSKLWMV